MIDQSQPRREIGDMTTTVNLDYLGIKNVNNIYWNLTTPALYEESIRRRESIISEMGTLIVRTGAYTGRSPEDKFIVRNRDTEKKVNWSKDNKPFDEKDFDRIYHRMLGYLQGNDIFIEDCYAGADQAYRVPIRIITEYAWHSLFVRNLLVRIDDLNEYQNFKPEFTILDLPRYHGVPELDHTKSEAFIIINFSKKLILIGATSYAGEIKKSIFSTLNFIYPKRNILPMHCGANQGKNGDVALFFGLSGTGKTTLSADPKRKLIGDDEHGWSDHGIFNFEGGCYAKVIRLSEEDEPDIYAATRRFGTVLENVVFDTYWHRPDFNDDTYTPNTRAAYPIHHISNSIASGIADHPENLIFLTADAFGILPPVAKLTPEQAMYHFLSGYTAKVAGTERGLGKEPEATFSTCFGSPFMPLYPNVYSSLLGKRIKKHNVKCWLVNTGWVGGPYGVGHRISIKYNRAILDAILEKRMDNIPYLKEEVFGLRIPKSLDGIPEGILYARNSWKNKSDYDNKRKELANKFIQNFEKYKNYVDEAVIQAGPVV
jgi:phosphoenolpyruvate carboxykinase (ATP)